MAEIDSPAEVGHRVRLVRLAVKRTQEQMADEFGVSRTTWVNYESGHRTLDSRLAGRVKQRYGYTTDWFFTGDRAGLSRLGDAALQQVIDEYGESSADYKLRGSARRAATKS